MRRLVAPAFDAKEVYQACIGTIANRDLCNRLNSVITDVVEAANIYQQQATAGQLYLVSPNNGGNDEVVAGEVTKKELKNVYSSQMVKRPEARKFYDELLSQAPQGKCPYCGFGQASTLDHYLPKANYPLVAVLPLNLVPSCKDCNIGKGTAVATEAEKQCLHPYFDHHKFVDEQWLFAEVQETIPATIRFYVQSPIDWDDVSKERVQSHFEGFNLAKKYSSEVNGRLSSLSSILTDYRELGFEMVRGHLQIEKDSYCKLYKNSWETAMYQALAVSDWYCNGGFESE